MKNLQRFDTLVLNKFQEVLRKNEFIFRELLFLEILTKAKISLNLADSDLIEMTESVQQWLPDLKNGWYRFVICKRGEIRFSQLIEQNASVYFDCETTEELSFDLEELAKELNLHLNSIVQIVQEE